MLRQALVRAATTLEITANTRIGFCLSRAHQYLTDTGLGKELAKMVELNPKTAPVVEQFSKLQSAAKLAKEAYVKDECSSSTTGLMFGDDYVTRVGMHFVDQKIASGAVKHDEALLKFVESFLEPSEQPLQLRASPGRVTEVEAVYAHQFTTSNTRNPRGEEICALCLVAPEEHSKFRKSVGFTRDNVKFYELQKSVVDGVVSLVGTPKGVTVVPHGTPEQVQELADAVLSGCMSEHIAAISLMHELGVSLDSVATLDPLEAPLLCAATVSKALTDVVSAIEETRNDFPEEFAPPPFQMPSEDRLKRIDRDVVKEATTQVENQAYLIGLAHTLYKGCGLLPASPLVQEALECTKKQMKRLVDFGYCASGRVEHEGLKSITMKANKGDNPALK